MNLRETLQSRILYMPVTATGKDLYLGTSKSSTECKCNFFLFSSLLRKLPTTSSINDFDESDRGTSDAGKLATTYKSEKRKELEDEGYTIHGSSGDQWSDLLGFAVAKRSFKLPNPMYYIA